MTPTSRSQWWVRNIVVFTILANIFLAYPFSNILIGFIPLNEILLIATLFLIKSEIFILLKTNKILYPLILWSILNLLITVPLGYSKYGLFALRDASHLIEVYWILVALSVFSSLQNFNEALSRFLKIFTWCFFIKLLAIAFKSELEGVFVVQGVQGPINLFSSNSGMQAAVFLTIGFLLCGIKIPRILPLLALATIIILQSRGLYIGITIMIVIRIILSRQYVFYSLKYLTVLAIVLLLLQIISSLSLLDQYTRFGIENVSPEKIYEHVQTSFGESDSETFEGAALGVSQRSDWFNQNIKKALEDGNIFLWGQGFGMPLTDFTTTNVVREPHNSYLSVFSRTGIVGLVIWLCFHMVALVGTFIIVQNKNSLDLLAPVLLILVALYAFAYVEPVFESPYLAIPIYILIGVVLNCRQRIRPSV